MHDTKEKTTTTVYIIKNNYNRKPGTVKSPIKPIHDTKEKKTTTIYNNTDIKPIYETKGKTATTVLTTNYTKHTSNMIFEEGKHVHVKLCSFNVESYLFILNHTTSY